MNKNKNLIGELLITLNKLGVEVFTAEIPRLRGALPRGFFRWLGVSYDIKKYPHTKIIMYYTSMIRSSLAEKLFRDSISNGVKRYGNNFQVGLGTIAVGVFGNEPIMELELLERDLELVRNCGIETVTIYPMGGLNRKYLSVIREYLS